jgi:hypothetical protein
VIVKYRGEKTERAIEWEEMPGRRPFIQPQNELMPLNTVQ